jgi:hypothetical protein
VVPGWFGEGPFEPAAAALTAAVVLACPPDRRADRRLSAVAGALAAVAWFPVALVETRNFVVSTHYGVWPLMAVIVTGAVLILRDRSSGVRELGAMAAASPLFLAHAYANGWLDLPPAAGTALALAMPALACLAACIRILASDGPRSP